MLFRSGNKKIIRLKTEVFGLDFACPVGIELELNKKNIRIAKKSLASDCFIQIDIDTQEEIRTQIQRLPHPENNRPIAACIRTDYQRCFALAYDFFDFFVIDISADPSIEHLSALIQTRDIEDNYKPIIVRIPNFISEDELQQIVDYCMLYGIDGIQSGENSHIQSILSLAPNKLPLIAQINNSNTLKAEEYLSKGVALINICSFKPSKDLKFARSICKSLMQKTVNQ